MLSLCADQQYVAEYRLDVYGGPEGDRIDCFGWKHLKTHPPTFASRATFSDKVSLGAICVYACIFTGAGTVSVLILCSI